MMARKETDEHDVPVLDSNDIELKAEEVISYFNPNILKRPMLTPLIDFIGELHEKFKLIWDYTRDLGITKQGEKILGKTQLKPLGIFVDGSLLNDPRFSFVLGHEFGHVVLHRAVEVKGIVDDEQEITRNMIF